MVVFAPVVSQGSEGRKEGDRVEVVKLIPAQKGERWVGERQPRRAGEVVVVGS